MALPSVDHGHEAEVNADVEAGAALLTALRAWLREELGNDGPCEPGAADDGGSDEEVA